MDLMFLDSIDFELPAAAAAICLIRPTMEEAAQRACELVGIELVDYGSVHFDYIGSSGRGDAMCKVRLRSTAWREKTAPRLRLR